MKFDPPLLSGRLIQRYKRFLADIELDDGRRITATCPNTGSMLGLTAPGSKVWVSVSASPTRKYAHTWELIEASDGPARCLVGINTSHPNRLVAEAIGAGQITELQGYPMLRREVKYGINSRIDILLDGASGRPPAYIEIKNVHLSRRQGLAEFPDSKTERGVKHLQELSAMAAAGHRAVMLYVIQRDDADGFAIAADMDPSYAAACDTARRAGVEMLSYRCTVSPQAISLADKVQFRPLVTPGS